MRIPSTSHMMNELFDCFHKNVLLPNRDFSTKKTPMDKWDLIGIYLILPQLLLQDNMSASGVFRCLEHTKNLLHFAHERNPIHICLSGASTALYLYNQKYSKLVNVGQSIVIQAQKLSKGERDRTETCRIILQLTVDVCAIAFLLKGGAQLALLAYSAQAVLYLSDCAFAIQKEEGRLILTKSLNARNTFREINKLRRKK